MSGAPPAGLELEEGARWVAHNRIRRATVKAMTRSAEVPQFTLQRDARIDALLELRSARKRDGSAVSVSDLLTAAVARALDAHPDVNASYHDGGVVQHGRVNVGIALATPAGLVVVCVADADRRSLDEIAGERARLTRAAVEGALTPADVLGTTFTVSNLGPLGVTRFAALVNPPQAAILAVGAPTVVPEPDAAGGVAWQRRLCLSLSCDHRALDGAPAAAFLASLADAIERPAWLEER